VVRESVKSIKAWQHADQLVVEVYRATQPFPKAELYGLTSQIRRAAVSVPANIAEGSQRYTLKEYRQFLYTTMASLAEVEYYIHLAQRLSYLSAEEGLKLEEMAAETARTLRGLMNWLEAQIRAGICYRTLFPILSDPVILSDRRERRISVMPRRSLWLSEILRRSAPQNDMPQKVSGSEAGKQTRDDVKR
jgi:four helix bundle protein